MIAVTDSDMAKLCFAAAAFILAAITMVLLIWRDRRPRPDTWQTIVRRDLPTPPERRKHVRSFEHRHMDVTVDKNGDYIIWCGEDADDEAQS